MRHLMWVLTWIALGIGGALGAASVIMLSGGRTPATVPEVIAGGKGEPVLVDSPRSNGQGRSAIAPHRRSRAADALD
jgi:hypothetical protein